MFFKHYTLTFDVKAADLTDISVAEPVAEVAMRHELLDQPDEMIQRRGRRAMFRDWARQVSRDSIGAESGVPESFRSSLKRKDDFGRIMAEAYFEWRTV